MENLTPLEATIMGILERHKGRENSVSKKDLVDRVNQHWAAYAAHLHQDFGGQEASVAGPLFLARRSRLPARALASAGGAGGPLNERTIRQTIKHLVEFHGQWIGSSPKGYFMVQTDQELMGVCKYYRGYGLSALHIEAKLRKISLPALLGQLSMEFSDTDTVTGG